MVPCSILSPIAASCTGEDGGKTKRRQGQAVFATKEDAVTIKTDAGPRQTYRGGGSTVPEGRSR